MCSRVIMPRVSQNLKNYLHVYQTDRVLEIEVETRLGCVPGIINLDKDEALWLKAKIDRFLSGQLRSTFKDDFEWKM